MTKCGWCQTNYVTWQRNCSNCGGPLPPPPGMDLGPPPPDAPRQLPKGYEFRVKWSRNLTVIFGCAFMGFAAIFCLATIMAPWWFRILPVLFFLGGVAMFRSGRRQANGVLRALRHGLAAEGKIHSLDKDTSQSINGRHPWRLVYHFTVEDQICEGILIAWDSTLSSRHIGQPLWVLYVAEDPAQNTIYPPLK